jgi:hypothetical protein
MEIPPCPTRLDISRPELATRETLPRDRLVRALPLRSNGHRGRAYWKGDSTSP